MRIFRSILAALLALSLAVTPAAARAAFAVMDTPAAPSHSSYSKMAAMPDCHRAMMQHEAGQPAKDTHHKKCPDCDKRGSCNADVCQLKCFKVLGAVAEARRPLAFGTQRFDALAPAALEPVSSKPQTPPPRT
jgi:hypothetical protein